MPKTIFELSVGEYTETHFGIVVKRTKYGWEYITPKTRLQIPLCVQPSPESLKP